VPDTNRLSETAMIQVPQNKNYWLETYGCQMNKAESEAIAIELNRAGYGESPDAAHADLVILNTCAVRQTAEERIHGRLGHYRHLKARRHFILAVMGCMSERLKEDLRRQYPEIDIIIGTYQKNQITEALEETSRDGQPYDRLGQVAYQFAAIHSRQSFKAFVPIMHGCENYCSYCIVPYVRGPEISRNPEDILDELRVIRRHGVREATLLGQNVNSYRYGKNGAVLDFTTLLELIACETPPGDWIRFLTSHPKDCTRALVECIATHASLCSHIHLPVQHGSDRILSLMNRGYTRQGYLELIHMIKNTISQATVTTDILIGFPSETDEDVSLTLELMEEVEFDDAYTYYYNPRQGTKAFAMGDTVDYDMKLQRLQRVIDLTRRLKKKRQLSRVGKDTLVLVEGISKKQDCELLGRTEHDEMVVFPGPHSLIGTFVTVSLQELQGTTFRAILHT
jgi:tRNA-2-methylthio-N6-dimethylallyladenosine synthase